MKLYELRRGDTFRLAEAPAVPPGSIEPLLEGVYSFDGMDGMYGKARDAGNNLHFFGATTDVERVERPA